MTAMSERRHYESASVSRNHIVQIRPFGYLDSVEIRFKTPVPNMDASNPLRLLVEPLFEGSDFEVFAVCREVEMHR